MNYKLRIKKNRNKGYTLIETMIAISIFTIIVMIGMGALLNANSLHNKSKDMLSIINSLSFTMDDMSRNLRTGYSYSCISTGGAKTAITSSVYPPLSGQNCWGIAFEPSGGGPMWAYEIVSPLDGSTNPYITRTEDGGATWVTLTPNEAIVNTTISSFSILGAEPPPTATPPGNDYQQPFVTIKLGGSITYKTVVSPFSLQTSVSQRQIDI